MKVSRIKWQTDGEAVNLPSEVEVADHLTDDEIVDYLSDTYGFLVESCSIPMTDDDIDEFGQHVNAIEAQVS